MQAIGDESNSVEGAASKVDSKIQLLPGMASHASVLMPAHTSRFLAIAGSIPASEKRALDEAVLKCPELVSAETDSRKFLLVSDNDVHAAGRRMVEYWNQRVRLFEENAHKPLIQAEQGALSSGDVFLLKEGFISHPGYTVDGVPIICFDVTKCADCTQGRLRGAFYASHHIACSPAAHDNGVVLLLILTDLEMQKNETLTQFVKLIRTALPLQLQSVHCFFTGSSEALTSKVPEDAIFQQLDLKELQDAGLLQSHFTRGSDPDILEKFGKIGITPECLPEAVGGTFVHKEELETYSVWKSFECERSRLKSTKGWPELKVRPTVGPDLLRKLSGPQGGGPQCEQASIWHTRMERGSDTKAAKFKTLKGERSHLADTEYAIDMKRSTDPDLKMPAMLTKASEPVGGSRTLGNSSPDGATVCKKREMNIIYSKRKREKKKQQIEALQTQHYDVSNENVKLKRENARLERLLAEATESVEEHELAAKHATLDRFNALQPLQRSPLTQGVSLSSATNSSALKALLATYGSDRLLNDREFLTGERERNQAATLIASLLGSNNASMHLPSASVRSRQESDLLQRLILEEEERRQSLLLRQTADLNGQRLRLHQTMDHDALIRKMREEAVLAALPKPETPQTQLVAHSLAGAAALPSRVTMGAEGMLQGQLLGNSLSALSSDFLNQVAQMSGLNERFIDNPEIIEILRSRGLARYP